jgi:hypothetical protein
MKNSKVPFGIRMYTTNSNTSKIVKKNISKVHDFLTNDSNSNLEDIKINTKFINLIRERI